MSRLISKFCLGLALCASGAARAAEDFSTWAHSAKLRLNTTASGANVAKSIGNFALLVRITDSRILNQSMATGADVRFADQNGVALDFQVERWAPTAGKAEFWVRVPKVDSLSDTQFLNVHWGKPGSAWLSDANRTFVKDVSYTMVYHLGEASTQARTNSAGNYNHAGPQNYEGDERVQGVIGMADSLDGSIKGGDYLDLGAGFTDLGMFSFTAWAKPAGAGIWERFLDLGNGEANENLIFSRAKASEALSVHAFGTSTPYNQLRQTGGGIDLGYVNSGNALETGKWGYFGFSIAGKIVSIYKNGEKIHTGELGAEMTKVMRLRNFIGHSNWLSDIDFKGVLDEVQMYNGLHSLDWMRLSYESQRPDARMFTWEFPADVKLVIGTQPVGATVAEGNSFKLTVAAVSSAAISYQWTRNGAALSGATAATFAVASATLEHSGIYACRLTNGVDTVVSKPAAIFVPEVLETWSHSQKVFINTAATGANLSAEVVNIPILVRLGRKSIDFSQVGEGGKDLRFATADGSALAHSIERWAADTAEVWVRVTKVAANANGYFLMYWGKTAARQGSSPGNVFSLNDGWRLYYDFSEAPTTGGDAQPKDATLNSLRGHGTGIVSVADGAIGKAFSFNAASRIESPVSALDGLKTFTVMAWMRGTATSNGNNIIEMPTIFGSRHSSSSQGEFGVFSNNGNLGYWHGFSTSPPLLHTTTDTEVGDEAWHLVAIAHTGNNITLYADGIALGSMATENFAMGPNPLAIGGPGAGHDTWSGMFTGDIDAVQATGDAKSQDWIKLAYEIQRPGSGILRFGAPASPAPPAPFIYPPAGRFDEAIQVQITCASDSARIFYTVDGTEPDTVARGSTRIIGTGLTLTTSTTVKAKAYWRGKSSTTTSAAYLITALTANGDTLRPGATKNIDLTHRVSFPNQDSKSPVRLTAGPAWNPLPPGFDRVGPLFTLAAVDTSAAFPGLALEGDSLTGLSLFRRNPNFVIQWMPPKDGQLWIPAAGTYFWGRDTLPPRIRYTGSGARGDSVMARIIIEDNVTGVQGKVVWSGGKDSLGWWSAAAGEILEFTIPSPVDPATPLEARFSARDQSRATQYPNGGAITLPRPIPAMTAPLDLKPGIQWKMAGMPLLAEGSLSLRDLAQMSGTGPLYAAVWRSTPSPDTGYLILKGDDKLPPGKGFWLAAETAAPSLNFPTSRAVASDSDGLFTLKLGQGWNLVTCPSFRPLAWPVSVKDGDAYLRSPLKPLHGLASSGYSRPDSLRPWEAYYVWYDKDTTVRVGRGAPRVSDGAKAPKGAAAVAKSLRLNLTGPGALLDLGATAFALSGLGREDESRPPPVDARASAWLAREGRALAVDYVSFDSERAMAWTVTSRGQAQDAAFSVSDLTLPAGIEAWAVSPSRRLKWRLLSGSNIPVTGDDTLAVYAGTPRALAKIGDLLRGRDAAGAFAARLRPAAGGLELVLELPSQARLSLSLYDTQGRRLGGLTDRPLAAGRHAFTWQSLAPGQAPLPQGAYYLKLDAQGPDWTRHQVHPITLIH